jgi:hypothetical protein
MPHLWYSMGASDALIALARGVLEASWLVLLAILVIAAIND